jgi:hypothetical protein
MASFDPTTRLATSLLSHRLGTHLIADERVTKSAEATAETVLYEMLTGCLQVSIVTQADGSLFAPAAGPYPATIAEVRVVENQSGGLTTLEDIAEVGCPRISIVWATSNPMDRQGWPQFDLQVSSGTVPPQHAEGFVVALEVANALVSSLRVSA